MSGKVSCKRCHRRFQSGSSRPSAPLRCPRCGFTFVHRQTPPVVQAAVAQAEAAPAGPSDVDHLALRADLAVEPVEENGALYFVIKDPVDNRFFRVKPLEHYLISQFDGRTPLETIRRRASDDRRVLVSEEVLSRFAQKFRELGLLVDGSAPPAREAKRHGLENVFSLRFPLANPERLLDWLYPKVRLCFGPSFVAAAVVAILVASVVAAWNSGALAFGLASAVSLEGLLFVIVTVALVTALHELAHGLTCRHFGGSVTDMGFLLLYFLPCFYCNVSDTYLFREKRQRLWVFFAGGFFELFLWAMAVLAWRIVTPETFASRVLFVVVAVCGIRSLFNFNPLIKMDGYFMLSEWLGIANLRKESLGSLERGLRRMAGLGATDPREDIRERRIFAISGDRFLALFGGAAIAYTVALVGAIVLYSGGFLFQNFGADALAMFSLVLVGLLHKPAFNAASAAKEAGREKWETLGQQKKRPRFLLLWGGLALVIAFFPFPLRVGADLEVFPSERRTVRALVEGRIGRIHVTEGERVTAGQLLLEYDTTGLRLERAAKEAEIEKAKEELRVIEGTTLISREQIVLAQRALDTTRTQRQAAQRVFDQHQELWTNGLISQDQFDRAKDELEREKARVREAEAAIGLAVARRDRQRADSLGELGRSAATQREVIKGLEAELGAIDDRLERARIYADLSGIVTTYRFEEKVGDFLAEGDDVCEIVNDDRVVIEMQVPEQEMDIVEAGQRVKFKVRSHPTRSFEGTVDEIAPIAKTAGKVSTVLIRAIVDNPDKALKPGTTGVAKIYTGLSVVGHILTRDIIRFVRTEFWL